MFRRPIFFIGRPFLRRPRLLGTAAVAGLGYAIGRGSRTRPDTAFEPAPTPQSPPDPVARLKELAELHSAGKLTDEEFSAAKRRLLGL